MQYGIPRKIQMDKTFKNFMTVYYRPGEDSQVMYNAHKRKHNDTTVVEDDVKTTSATKKPQEYIDADGRTKTRMVPSKQDIVDNDKDDVKEALDVTARRKKALLMKKNKARVQMGQKRAKKKIADPKRIKRRAQRQARQQIFNKLSKNVGRQNMSLARRREVEKRVDKQKAKVNRLAKKLVPKVRKAEMGRSR